ncbi:MAG: YncE family protein [Thermoanaerobaculia bacterium]
MKTSFLCRTIPLAVASFACTALLARAAEPPKAAVPEYAVTAHFAVGGEGGWDYLVADAKTKRLYVPRSTRVAILDSETGKAIGEIPNTQGVHGVALAHDLGKGFTSNGRAGTVTVFDLASLKVLSEMKVTGENPDAILYEPVTKRVFTFNGRTANVTAFDGASGAVAGTIPVGGKPEFAASDASGRVFVNIEDKSEIAVIDAKTLTVTARWALSGCEDPTGLALDAKGGRLYSGCGNKVAAVVSTADGKLLATVPTGQGTDGVAFDPGKGLAFVSNGEGTLTVIRETTPGVFSAIQNVSTERGARTVALDAATHRLYLPTAKFGPPPSPTPERPNPRPSAVPGSFEILVVTPK